MLANIDNKKVIIGQTCIYKASFFQYDLTLNVGCSSFDNTNKVLLSIVANFDCWMLFL